MIELATNTIKKKFLYIPIAHCNIFLFIPNWLWIQNCLETQSYITLFIKSITMYVGLTILCEILFTISMYVSNILHNYIVGPT